MNRWRIVLPAGAGLFSAGLAWVMGVVTVDAALLGVLMAVLVGTPRWLGYPADREWPDDPQEGGQRGFYEVRRLAAIFGRETGGDPFGRLIVPRLRELSERRLASAGVRLDDVAAREILGAEVADWLNGRPSRFDRHSRVKQAELVLDRLEEINERYA